MINSHNWAYLGGKLSVTRVYTYHLMYDVIYDMMRVQWHHILYSYQRRVCNCSLFGKSYSSKSTFNNRIVPTAKLAVNALTNHSI